MDIYQFAMQMEKDGEDYYRALAREATVPGLAKVFTMLADDEVRHYQVVEGLSRDARNPLLADSKILERVANVFAAMQAAKEELCIDTSKVAVEYRKARDIEEASRKFYQDKAALVEAGPSRDLFLRLAAEEERHLRIMENIVEFVTRQEPGNWLENAEWHHLEDY